MRNLRYSLILLCGVTLMLSSCDPIEDEDLRANFESSARITQEDLNAIVSVDQPFENRDGIVEGDQYVVVKNLKPEIAGCWHVRKGELDLRSGSDHDTIVCPSNGTWSVYFETVSQGKSIQSTPVDLTVTNVFDIWSTYLTGAKDKTDKSAKKIWQFRECENVVCYNGAYGFWNYTPLDKVTGNAWWGQTSLETAGNQTMEFVFDKNGFKTFKQDGSLNNEGEYNCVHSTPDIGVVGELLLTVPIIGFEFNDVNINNEGKYWILELDDKKLTVAVPRKFEGAVEWVDDVWIAFFEAVE